MNSLQDHHFFILVSYGVSALLVAIEVMLLWRRSRMRDSKDVQSVGESRS